MTDYISRDAARETLLTAYPLLQHERLDTVVSSIPAADVVPKDFHERCLQIEIQKRMALEKADVRPVVHGKREDDWETGCSTCSACGESYLWEDYDGVGEWNYCPNCGADMREES